jgi:acyl-CoA synthetase (AMP-forming)/AMP-acid ligase II
MNSNQLIHLLLDEAANTWPNEIAIQTGERTITFKELQHMAVISALWLKEHGVQAGDRVVIDGDNSIETVAQLFGVLAVGAAFCLGFWGLSVLKRHKPLQPISVVAFRGVLT